MFSCSHARTSFLNAAISGGSVCRLKSIGHSSTFLLFLFASVPHFPSMQQTQTERLLISPTAYAVCEELGYKGSKSFLLGKH